MNSKSASLATRSPSVSLSSASCGGGRHGDMCIHIAVQHGDHVGYLNDDGMLDCMVNGKMVTHMLVDAQGDENVIVSRSSHRHGPDCGHLPVQHNDHIDYVVDGALQFTRRDGASIYHGTVVTEHPIPAEEDVQEPIRVDSGVIEVPVEDGTAVDDSDADEELNSFVAVPFLNDYERELETRKQSKSATSRSTARPSKLASPSTSQVVPRSSVTSSRLDVSPALSEVYPVTMPSPSSSDPASPSTSTILSAPSAAASRSNVSPALSENFPVTMPSPPSSAANSRSSPSNSFAPVSEAFPIMAGSFQESPSQSMSALSLDASERMTTLTESPLPSCLQSPTSFSRSPPAPASSLITVVPEPRPTPLATPLAAPAKKASHRHKRRKHHMDMDRREDDDRSAATTKWYQDEDAPRFIALFTLTAIYFFVEMVVGTMYGSLALIADAMHMLSDLIALVIGYVAMRKAKQGSSYGKTYGQRRMEIVASMMNAVFMLALCLNMYTEATNKFLEGFSNTKLQDNIDTVLIVAGVGLCINIFGMLVFGGHGGHGHSHGGGGGGGHGHSHGGSGHGHAHSTRSHSHSHGDHSHEKPKRSLVSRILPADLNVRGILLHWIGDAMGSLATIVSALLIKYLTFSWRLYADPIAAVIIALLISVGTVPLVKITGKILLMRTPESVDGRGLMRALLSTEHVHEVHEFHVWTLTNNVFIASMHVVIEHGADFMAISDAMKKTLHAFGVHSSTIQPEFLPSTEGAHGEMLRTGNTCHEPMCHAEECLPNMCCPNHRQHIVRLSKEHRPQKA